MLDAAAAGFFSAVWWMPDVGDEVWGGAPIGGFVSNAAEERAVGTTTVVGTAGGVLVSGWVCVAAAVVEGVGCEGGGWLGTGRR
jgi:hypothetical protein